MLQKSGVWRRGQPNDPSKEVCFLRVEAGEVQLTTSSRHATDSTLAIEVKYAINRHLDSCQIGARVSSAEGVPILTTADSDTSGQAALPRSPGLFTTKFRVPVGLLAPGTYTVLVAAHVPGRCVYDSVEQAVTFGVSSSGSLKSLDGRQGVVDALLPWQTSKEPSD
ncbi:MAG: Wzt carbohydrate-binding domain-containing protein [Chloroflexota bacterium]